MKTIIIIWRASATDPTLIRRDHDNDYTIAVATSLVFTLLGHLNTNPNTKKLT
jgi:hypothetical protein